MNTPVTANFDELLTASVSNVSCEYTDRDVMLYALGVGFAHPPSDPRELNYVYDGRALQTVPSMAGIVVNGEFLESRGLDLARVAVVQQKLELYRPLPARAELQFDSRVRDVVELEQQAGLCVIVDTEVRMARDATVLFNLSRTLRSEPAKLRAPAGVGPAPHALPTRAADLSCELTTSPILPFIFRLCGDRRARYVEDVVARSQGFARAPLPEQCAAGIGCRAILRTICEYDATLISGFDMRFAGALYPDETVVTEMWQDRNIVSFRCSVPARDAIIIDNGKCTLAV